MPNNQQKPVLMFYQKQANYRKRKKIAEDLKNKENIGDKREYDRIRYLEKKALSLVTKQNLVMANQKELMVHKMAVVLKQKALLLKQEQLEEQQKNVREQVARLKRKKLNTN